MKNLIFINNYKETKSVDTIDKKIVTRCNVDFDFICDNNYELDLFCKFIYSLDERLEDFARKNFNIDNCYVDSNKELKNGKCSD